MRIRRLMSGLSERSLTGLEQEWQQALAASFLAASKGDDTDRLAPVNKRIIDTLKAEGAPEENLALIDGIFTRLHYSFRRTATMIKEARA